MCERESKLSKLSLSAHWLAYTHSFPPSLIRKTRSMGSLDYHYGNLQEPVNVAEYLWRRVYQVGIRSAHGLPRRQFDLAGFLAESRAEMGRFRQ